jgi:hypothetical protein
LAMSTTIEGRLTCPRDPRTTPYIWYTSGQKQLRPALAGTGTLLAVI